MVDSPDMQPGTISTLAVETVLASYLGRSRLVRMEFPVLVTASAAAWA